MSKAAVLRQLYEAAIPVARGEGITVEEWADFYEAMHFAAEWYREDPPWEAPLIAPRPLAKT